MGQTQLQSIIKVVQLHVLLHILAKEQKIKHLWPIQNLSEKICQDFLAVLLKNKKKQKKKEKKNKNHQLCPWPPSSAFKRVPLSLFHFKPLYHLKIIQTHNNLSHIAGKKSIWGWKKWMVEPDGENNSFPREGDTNSGSVRRVGNEKNKVCYFSALHVCHVFGYKI